MLFPFRKKKRESYDPALLKPVIRVSICTGEETAGFRDLKTGKFREVQLIRNEKDLRDFMACYDILDIPPREY